MAEQPQHSPPAEPTHELEDGQTTAQHGTEASLHHHHHHDDKNHDHNHNHAAEACACEHHHHHEIPDASRPFGPGMYLHAHPAWPCVEEELKTLPPFVVACKPILTDLFGAPIHPGWRFEAHIRAPAGSLYAGTESDYAIELALAENFPRLAPRIRWLTSMTHIQIDEMGLMTPGIFQWDSQQSSFLDCLRFCHGLLAAPVKSQAQQEEEELSTDAELEEQWSEHDPTCECTLVPCPYPVYLKATPEQRVELLRDLRRRLAEHDREEAKEYTTIFQRAAELAATLSQCQREWMHRTKHQQLYRGEWQPEWFAESFLSAWRLGTKEAFDAIVKVEAPGLFSVDLFTPAFCRELSQELLDFEATSLPKRRPNSMNNYGVILNDIGLHSLMTALVTTYLQPLAHLYLPEASGGLPFDCHHSFMVQYEDGMDRILDMHSDDSEVTFNVNICDRFTGAGLLFCGMHGSPDRRLPSLEYQHRLGRAVIHAGLHRHGAEQLLSGQRLNVIVWCRSSLFRESAGYAAARSNPTHGEHDPDRRCVSRVHDPDANLWLNMDAAQ
jgi:hypothetical protein